MAIKATPSGYAARTPRIVPRVVPVHYLRTASIVVRGNVTGRRYTFSGDNPVQSVDARDAAGLLRTCLFR